MKMLLAAVSLSLALGACATPETPAAPEPQVDVVAAAIADPNRPQEDRDRDAARKPADMLAFAGIAPGQTIADFIPGGGYFTRLFANAVGDAGRVYALAAPPQPNQTGEPPINAVAAQHANVTIVPLTPASLAVPAQVDIFFTAQNYHDLHLTRLNLDVAAANRQIFNAVKPGGVLVVVDHSALAGAEIGVADTLHRIDQAIARREIEAAGFVFEAESDVLRNPDDPRTASVFDPGIRGRTDQFVMRFRKPA